MTVKVTGSRSIQSKLQRLAYEFEHDANRIQAELADFDLAGSLRDLSRKLGALHRSLEGRPKREDY